MNEGQVESNSNRSHETAFRSHFVPIINDDGARHIDLVLHHASGGQEYPFIHAEGTHHPPRNGY